MGTDGAKPEMLLFEGCEIGDLNEEEKVPGALLFCHVQ